MTYIYDANGGLVNVELVKHWNLSNAEQLEFGTWDIYADKTFVTSFLYEKVPAPAPATIDELKKVRNVNATAKQKAYHEAETWLNALIQKCGGVIA